MDLSFISTNIYAGIIEYLFINRYVLRLQRLKNKKFNEMRFYLNIYFDSFLKQAPYLCHMHLSISYYFLLQISHEDYDQNEHLSQLGSLLSCLECTIVTKHKFMCLIFSEAKETYSQSLEQKVLLYGRAKKKAWVPCSKA